MSPLLPSSPSFVSLSTATASSPEPDELPPTPKVRFDQSCVLIPDPLPASRLPRLVTKSYSLPLWKRKRDPSIPSEDEDDLSEDHVVLKVSVPSITTKARSSSRDAYKPLTSCLVHHDPSSSTLCNSPPLTRVGRPRRASLPAPVQTEAITVPLRACCAQCYASIDKCTKAGDHWEVHFSRGALRRRKSVSDAHTPSRSHLCVRSAMPGFDSIVAVDEVDRRRKSTEIDPSTAFTIEMPETVAHASTIPEDIPLRRALSLPDAIHPCRAKPHPDVHPCVLSPPILEEDEHRPSPRRTPIPSPFASTTNLPSTRVGHSHHQSVTVEKTPAIAIPIKSSSEYSLLDLDGAFASSPITLTPPNPLQEKEPPRSYFMEPSLGYDSSLSYDSPSSSPSVSPEIAHAKPAYLRSVSPSRRNPIMGSIFRASSQVLKGISNMGGVPMSA